MNKSDKTTKGDPAVGRQRRVGPAPIKKKHPNPKVVFTKIYQDNSWGDADSRSGRGSNLEQTRIIRQKLPKLFQEREISTILDIPSGDFYWMRDVDLGDIRYIGGDIVNEIIEKNKAQYENERRHFQVLNLIKDKLPRVDLVLCRDCLVHFSFRDTFLALENICHSWSTYLLTTFYSHQQNNKDISIGEWQPLNLTKFPFNLPQPLEVINEGCTEGHGRYTDKTLALWKIDSIASRLEGISATLDLGKTT